MCTSVCTCEQTQPLGGLGACSPRKVRSEIVSGAPLGKKVITESSSASAEAYQAITARSVKHECN